MKAKTLYLCRDDDPRMQSLTAVLEMEGTIKIDYSPPNSSWETEIDNITDAMVGKKCQGLLIDFRLDQTEDPVTKKKARYTAESVVNELRRRSIEGDRGNDHSYPIILWSTAQNLGEYYLINASYTGLYDGVWDKQTITTRPAYYRRRMQSLVKGYAALRAGASRSLSLQSVLNATSGGVHKEMEQTFVAQIRQARFAFNYAIFVLDRVLEPCGPLLNHDMVCAILGVSPMISDDAFQALLKKAPRGVRYTGVFSDSYERYWRAGLLEWLNSLADSGGWLSTDAGTRVSLLKQKLKIRGLKPCDPIDSSYGTDYDTICSISNQPLARRNGFRLREGSTDAWREPRFVAGVNYRTLTRDAAKAFHLDDDESARFAREFA